MKIVTWNCRGLLGTPTVQSLLDIQRRHRPDAFFLSETHLSDAKAEELKRKLGMDEMICEPSVDGRKGGLLLVWKEVRIYFRASTLDFIDVTVEEPNGDVWRMTGIYGEPSWDCKDRTYRLLRDLQVQSSLPWTILGDFNEILFSSEKEGGALRNQSRLQAFQDALSDYSLEDIGYIGDKFTWFRGGLKERLDRAISNVAWMELHPLVGLTNLEMEKSNHRPICLDTHYLSGVAATTQRRERRFEAKWLAEETVEEIVRTA